MLNHTFNLFHNNNTNSTGCDGEFSLPGSIIALTVTLASCCFFTCIYLIYDSCIKRDYQGLNPLKRPLVLSTIEEERESQLEEKENKNSVSALEIS